MEWPKLAKSGWPKRDWPTSVSSVWGRAVLRRAVLGRAGRKNEENKKSKKKRRKIFKKEKKKEVKTKKEEKKRRTE